MQSYSNEFSLKISKPNISRSPINLSFYPALAFIFSEIETFILLTIQLNNFPYIILAIASLEV
jgi:hypothetical protein